MAERAKAPVIAIALDSMELSLVRAGIEEGWLPTLASLAQRGRSGVLGGYQDLLPGASWFTMITSTPPDEHLMILDRHLASGKYAFERVTYRAVRRPAFWKYVGDAGLRTTVASVHGAPMVPGLPGTQLVGWGVHDPWTLWQSEASPPEVLDRMNREIGPRLTADEEPYRSHADFRRNLVRCLRGVGQQSAGLTNLLQTTTWDLFLGSFNEAHPIGHRMWHYHDPSHPRHEPDAPLDLQDGLRRLYRDMDAGLTGILKAAPEGATVVIYAVHGMGPNPLPGEPAEIALERGGWLVRSRASRGVLRVRTYAAARYLAQRVVPAPIRQAIGKRMPTELLLTQVSLANVDWSRTRAFAIPGDQSSLIRINLAGREEGGIVSSGEGYDQVCAEITDAMCQLVDDAGKPAVAEVVRTDALLGRPVEDVLPDLIVRWRDDEPLSRVRSDRLGVIEIPRLDIRTGAHRPDGWMIATGPNLEPQGEPLQQELGRLEDVGPTLLARLGIPIPAELRGEPIDSLRP